MKACCGNCNYSRRIYESKGAERKFKGCMCMNEDSDAYGAITDYKDICMDYEEREEKE